jgi:molecular chaperone DnaK (HSP70)
MTPVAQVLRDANMTKGDLTYIVLVGSSSRIPGVQQLLQHVFKGKQLCHGVNLDEAVAYGAPVQDAIIKGVDSEVTKGIMLLDATPLPLVLRLLGRS